MFLTRKFSFSAAHRYCDPKRSPQENLELFGSEANLHGHNYNCEVTVKGKVDPNTGVVIHLTDFGKKIFQAVGVELDRKELNALPFFQTRQPSPENIAIFVWERLAQTFQGMELHRVRVEESEESAAEYYGGKP